MVVKQRGLRIVPEANGRRAGGSKRSARCIMRLVSNTTALMAGPGTGSRSKAVVLASRHSKLPVELVCTAVVGGDQVPAHMAVCCCIPTEQHPIWYARFVQLQGIHSAQALRQGAQAVPDHGIIKRDGRGTGHRSQ